MPRPATARAVTQLGRRRLRMRQMDNQEDLWVKHRAWVLDPIRYPSVDRLVEVLDTEIIKPAEARFAELLARKAEDLRIKDI